MCWSINPFSGAPGKVSHESVDHGLFENRGCQLSVRGFDLEHDLIVQPSNRTAIDSRVEQAIVDISERDHRGVGAGALDRQVPRARIAGVVLFQAGEWKHPANSTRRILADHNAQFILAPLMTLALPAREIRIGILERLSPRLSLRSGENEIELLPRRAHQSGRALAVDRAEIHCLRAFAFFLGHVLRILARHSRCGDRVQVLAFLERACHRGIAKDVRSGA